MATIELIEDDNEKLLSYIEPETVDLIYADMVFDNFNLGWIRPCYRALKPSGSLFIHTDYRSVADVKIYTDEVFETEMFDYRGYLNNWIIWNYDWGGRPKTAFGRKHDDILWYVKTDEFQFYPKRVAIPKKTADSKGLNPSGRKWKIPTDVWTDIGNFHTASPERVRDEDGVSIPHQKPERLIERIVLCTTNEGDLVVDPFLGTGTTGVVCKRLDREFIGVDWDSEKINMAAERIRKA